MITKPLSRSIIQPKLKKQKPPKLPTPPVPHNYLTIQIHHNTIQRKTSKLNPLKRLIKPIIKRKHQGHLPNILIRHKNPNIKQRRQTTRNTILYWSKTRRGRLRLITKLHLNYIVGAIAQTVTNTQKHTVTPITSNTIRIIFSPTIRIQKPQLSKKLSPRINQNPTQRRRSHKQSQNTNNNPEKNTILSKAQLNSPLSFFTPLHQAPNNKATNNNRHSANQRPYKINHKIPITLPQSSFP